MKITVKDESETSYGYSVGGEVYFVTKAVADMLHRRSEQDLVGEVY